MMDIMNCVGLCEYIYLVANGGCPFVYSPLHLATENTRTETQRPIITLRQALFLTLGDFEIEKII